MSRSVAPKNPEDIDLLEDRGYTIFFKYPESLQRIPSYTLHYCYGSSTILAMQE